MTYSPAGTHVPADPPPGVAPSSSDKENANDPGPPSGPAFPYTSKGGILGVAEQIGAPASWVTWAILGSAVAGLASFRPLIYQTNASMLAQVQVKSGVSQASFVIGVLILAMTLLARYRPQFLVPVVVADGALSLAMLSLYVLLTAAGLVGMNENAGFGFYEKITWLPGPGMLLSAVGYAAVVLASILGFIHRPPAQPRTP